MLMKSSTMGGPWFSQLEGAQRCNGKVLFCQKNEQNVLRRAIKCQVWSRGARKTSCVYSHKELLWFSSPKHRRNLENAANASLIPWAYAQGTFWVSDLFFRSRFLTYRTELHQKVYKFIVNVEIFKTRGRAKWSCLEMASPSKVEQRATMHKGHPWK